MLIKEGTHRGLWWKITQSDTAGFWNRVLSVGDEHGCGHSAHVDRFRLDGNPRYVQDEIDRLIAAGLLPNKGETGMETLSAAERNLLAYMIGFRMGINAAALVAINRADGHLMRGYEAGRKAKQAAYAEASERYGAVLNPLRAVDRAPEPNLPGLPTVAEYDAMRKDDFHA